jgi:hypothetical protein
MYVKQEDEAKYRCKVPECTKLFKAEHFWRKHAEKRHEEWFQTVKNDLNLVNVYVLDPSHIAPSRSDSNSNGHFPLPTNHHLNTGTPRGFSLQNMGTNMMGFNQNAMMGMGMQNMAAAAGFVPGVNFNNPEGTNGHSGGPVRRGGRGYGGRPNQPYDRNQRSMQRGIGNVQSMLNGMGGTPYNSILAQGGYKSGGKWGDGAGNPMNVRGPPEATQGRSIKSYEDLDAQPDGGRATGNVRGGAAADDNAGAELDY